MAIAYGFSLSTTALTIGLFPSDANAGVIDCIGPVETMEVTDWNMQEGPSVPLSYWSSGEQTFLKEYIRRFHQDCMGLKPLDVEEAEMTYGRDGYQDLLDRVYRICKNETGGYGTNWDNFVRSLESFPSFCKQ